MHTRLPKRIVVFCLPGIGDTILFTPALGLLRRGYPSARITVVTMFRGTENIVTTNPDVDEVLHFDFFNASKFAGIRYVWGLRQQGFDLAIMAFPSNRLEYNVLNRLIGRRWRAAHQYRNQSRRNLWFLNNIIVREVGDLHNVVENLRLVRTIFEQIGTEMPATELPADSTANLKVLVTPHDAQYAAEFLAAKGVRAHMSLFGFHTYSSTFKNMHRKCWGRENFAALITRMGERFPSARFLLFCGPHDEDVTRYIMKRVDGRVIPVREVDLRRTAAIIQRCHLFISNDSGPMHLAAAMRVPIVALFGPTNAQRLHPWTKHHVVVRRDLPCSPCFQYSSCPLSCPAKLDYACMREISVDEVFTAVQDQLNATPLNFSP